MGYKEEEEEEGEGEGRETGTQFTDVDLTELEWAEYDERSGLSTLISGSSPAFIAPLFLLFVGLFLRLNSYNIIRRPEQNSSTGYGSWQVVYVGCGSGTICRIRKFLIRIQIQVLFRISILHYE
jgi:hypothetical protein